MSGTNNLSATQFKATSVPQAPSLADIPRSLNAGSTSQVNTPLPSMASTNTSQGSKTAWRTNSGGGPMPISSRTIGTTLHFDS